MKGCARHIKRIATTGNAGVINFVLRLRQRFAIVRNFSQDSRTETHQGPNLSPRTMRTRYAALK